MTWQGTRVTATDKLQSLNYSATTGRLTDTTDATGAAATFTYDAIGRRTSSVNAGQTVNYSWNVLGQLTAAGADTYSYDNSGLRSKVNGSQQVYGQDLKLLSDGTNKFLGGTDGSLLAQAPLGSGVSSAPSQAVTNGMGSVYEMVQAQPAPNTGTYQFAVQAQYSYSLFGERTLVAGTDVTTIGYVSEQLDNTTGLIYLRARYYDPKTAQFISSDPMLTKTLDEYGYGSGNPLQLVDPLGLDTTSDKAMWGNIGTGLGAFGLVVGIVGVSIGTWGIADLVLFVGFVSGAASSGITGGIAAADCHDAATQGTSGADCAWGLAGTAAGALPFTKGAKGIEELSQVKIPSSLSPVDQAALNASKFNAGFATNGINGLPLGLDLTNRGRVNENAKRSCR